MTTSTPKTDPLDTVPAEERQRIVRIARDESRTPVGYRAVLDREVAAWHARQGAPEFQPGYHHPDPATDQEVRLDLAEGRAIDKAAGIREGWHRGCCEWHHTGGRAASPCNTIAHRGTTTIPETLTREQAEERLRAHVLDVEARARFLDNPQRYIPTASEEIAAILRAYVRHLNRLAAASPEQIAKDHAVGLYRKFDVRRTDGSSDPGGKHEACEYFVLDWQHDPFTVPAVRAYADACEATYPALAADLRAKAEIIAAAKGQTPVGPAARITEEELAEIEARTADPPLAGDGPALRRLAAEVRALQAERDDAWKARDASDEDARDIRNAACALCVSLAPWKYEGSIEGPGANDVVEKHRTLCMALWGEITPPILAHEAADWQRRRAEMAARPAPAADASEEARAQKAHAAWVADRGRHLCAWDDDLPAAERTIWLAVVRAVDASRPGLTEEQARAEALRLIGWALRNQIVTDADVDHIAAALLRASRGEVEDTQAACMAAAERAGHFFDPETGRWSTPASRGEAPPAAPGVETEGLGPEPGILAPAASDAARPPVPAGHVSISRDVLSRLVDATLRDESVRGPREAAEHVLHLDLLRHEPARHDVGAARAAARANDPRPCPECHMSVAHKLGCSRRRGGQ